MYKELESGEREDENRGLESDHPGKGRKTNECRDRTKTGVRKEGKGEDFIPCMVLSDQSMNCFVENKHSR